MSTNGKKAAVTAVEVTQENVDSTSEVKIVVEPAVVEAKDKKGAESTTVPVKRGRGRPKKKQDTSSDVDGKETPIEKETIPKRSPRRRTPVESYAEESDGTPADEEEEEERESLKPPKRGRGRKAAPAKEERNTEKCPQMGKKAAVTAVEVAQENVVDSTSEVKIVVEPAVVEAKDKKGAESTTVPVKRGRGRPKKKQDTSSDVDGKETPIEKETIPKRSPRRRTPVESYAEESDGTPADEEEEEERESLKPPKRGRGRKAAPAKEERKPVKTAGAKKMLAEQSKGRKRGSGADSKNEESSENGAQEEEVVPPPAAKKRGGRGRKRAVVESDKPEPAENGNQAEEEEVITGK